jgi:hypothetical protein
MIEGVFVRSRRTWIAALAVILLLEAFTFRSAIGTDWYRSGNDMVAILAEARSATHAEVLSWITGPWIGKEIFVYYRPLTSLLMYAEYQKFGEHSAPWQILSLVLHLGATLFLALLCRRIFRSHVAGLVGAYAWGFRTQMGDAIAWTPAQTDLLAGCLALLSLLTLKIALDTRRWAWLLIAAPTALLAMGSKEATLILPVLATALILHAPETPRLRKAALIAGCWLLTAGFLAWRIHALGGLGFLPGHVLGAKNLGKGHSSAARIRPDDLMERALRFLLPTPLGPSAPVSLLTTVATAGFLLLLFHMRPSRLRLGVGVIGLLLLTMLLGDSLDPMDGLGAWLVSDTYIALIYGIVALGLVAFLIWLRPKDCALILTWGLACLAPLYHIVYNAAGNVFYLPDTYWALVWACFGAALTQPATWSASPVPPSQRG